MNAIALHHCRQIYENIVLMLETSSEEWLSSTDFFTGNWGVLLFLFYYENYCDTSQSKAAACLEHLYDKLNTDSHNFTYCSGLTGPIWLLNHLHENDFIDIDLDEIAGDFVSMAILKNEVFLDARNFDFLHGSSGIIHLLVHFAVRQDVKNHLSTYVHRLYEAAVETEHGLSFPTFYHYKEPLSDVGIDAFSLAHGSCAYQLLLLKIHKAGIETSLCERMISGSLAFILAHKNVPDKTGDALFPAYLDGITTQSRVSWCYGDLDVAFALWRCGTYFNNAYWQSEAISIFKHNVHRNTCMSASVVDVCLCHGTAGNAAMYMRIWQETKDADFLKCAADWYQLTCGMMQFSNDKSVHGLRCWAGNTDQWQYKWNLLEGSAGVGLALISQYVGAALPWDDFLLLS